MRLRFLLLLTAFYCLLILWAVHQNPVDPAPQTNGTYVEQKFNGPEEFFAFHKQIRTPDDAETHGYAPGFRVREFANAKASAVARKRSGRVKSNGVVEWKERGPNNVPGRTRGLIVDPDDPAKDTWFAGSVGGGVWKTTNGGTTWTLITPDLPNLATTVLAMAESNQDIIYLGTGEGFGNLDGITGNGLFKSTDRGQSWSYLPATNNFDDVNRAIVDPTNADVVVVATNSGIYRTTNGGTSWSKVSDRTWIQDLKATPENFTVQYATQRFVGVIKSVDGGVSWQLSNTGMNPSGRIEIDVSPVNTNRLFASAQGNASGSASDLYMSDNGGESWSLVNVTFNGLPADFLGGQGWYDNTIACDPFNQDIVYFGGVNIFRATLQSGTTSATTYSVEESNTSFLSLVNFGAGFFGGRLAVGVAANASVEIRFGAGKSQKAHRFLVPQGATSGVPDENYSYTDYVDVPFEVWDITNNRQLMVSFRDQDRNGTFNLRIQNTEGDPLTQSREYVFVNNVTYDPHNPNPSISVAGGQKHQEMYFFWPVLTAGKSWPSDITESKLVLQFISIPKRNAATITVSDAYGQFDSKNRFLNYGVDMHPDTHV